MSFTVLIAEDDPAMRRVLKKIAEEDGRLRVVGEAGNGTEALALFEKLRPRIVFVDIDLPLKDGVSLARDIFAREPRTHLSSLPHPTTTGKPLSRFTPATTW